MNKISTNPAVSSIDWLLMEKSAGPQVIQLIQTNDNFSLLQDEHDMIDSVNMVCDLPLDPMGVSSCEKKSPHCMIDDLAASEYNANLPHNSVVSNSMGLQNPTHAPAITASSGLLLSGAEIDAYTNDQQLATAETPAIATAINSENGFSNSLLETDNFVNHDTITAITNPNIEIPDCSNDITSTLQVAPIKYSPMSHPTHRSHANETPQFNLSNASKYEVEDDAHQSDRFEYFNQARALPDVSISIVHSTEYGQDIPIFTQTPSCVGIKQEKIAAQCNQSMKKQTNQSSVSNSSTHPHVCHLCGKFYRHVASLRNHVRKHESGCLSSKRFKCLYCVYSSQYNRNVLKHMKTIHNQLHESLPSEAEQSQIQSQRRYNTQFKRTTATGLNSPLWNSPISTEQINFNSPDTVQTTKLNGVSYQTSNLRNSLSYRGPMNCTEKKLATMACEDRYGLPDQLNSDISVLPGYHLNKLQTTLPAERRNPLQKLLSPDQNDRRMSVIPDRASSGFTGAYALPTDTFNPTSNLQQTAMDIGFPEPRRLGCGEQVIEHQHEPTQPCSSDIYTFPGPRFQYQGPHTLSYLPHADANEYESHAMLPSDRANSIPNVSSNLNKTNENGCEASIHWNTTEPTDWPNMSVDVGDNQELKNRIHDELIKSEAIISPRSLHSRNDAYATSDDLQGSSDTACTLSYYMGSDVPDSADSFAQGQLNSETEAFLTDLEEILAREVPTFDHSSTPQQSDWCQNDPGSVRTGPKSSESSTTKSPPPTSMKNTLGAVSMLSGDSGLESWSSSSSCSAGPNSTSVWGNSEPTYHRKASPLAHTMQTGPTSVAPPSCFADGSTALSFDPMRQKRMAYQQTNGYLDAPNPHLGLTSGTESNIADDENFSTTADLPRTIQVVNNETFRSSMRHNSSQAMRTSLLQERDLQYQLQQSGIPTGQTPLGYSREINGIYGAPTMQAALRPHYQNHPPAPLMTPGMDTMSQQLDLNGNANIRQHVLPSRVEGSTMLYDDMAASAAAGATTNGVMHQQALHRMRLSHHHHQQQLHQQSSFERRQAFPLRLPTHPYGPMDTSYGRPGIYAPVAPGMTDPGGSVEAWQMAGSPLQQHRMMNPAQPHCIPASYHPSTYAAGYSAPDNSVYPSREPGTFPDAINPSHGPPQTCYNVPQSTNSIAPQATGNYAPSMNRTSGVVGGGGGGGAAGQFVQSDGSQIERSAFPNGRNPWPTGSFGYGPYAFQPSMYNNNKTYNHSNAPPYENAMTHVTDQFPNPQQVMYGGQKRNFHPQAHPQPPTSLSSQRHPPSAPTSFGSSRSAVAQSYLASRPSYHPSHTGGPLTPATQHPYSEVARMQPMIPPMESNPSHQSKGHHHNVGQTLSAPQTMWSDQSNIPSDTIYRTSSDSMSERLEPTPSTTTSHIRPEGLHQQSLLDPDLGRNGNGMGRSDHSPFESPSVQRTMQPGPLGSSSAFSSSSTTLHQSSSSSLQDQVNFLTDASQASSVGGFVAFESVNATPSGGGGGGVAANPLSEQEVAAGMDPVFPNYSMDSDPS